MSRSEKTSRNLYIKGEVLREFGGISKTPKTFLINRNLKVLLTFGVDCHPTQCTKTVSECLWPHMDWVRMDCNLRLTVLKFLHFRSQNAQEKVMSCSLQEFN